MALLYHFYEVLAITGSVDYFSNSMKDSFLNRKFAYTYSNACMYIIIANVLVFFLTQFTNISYMGLSLQGWLSLIPSLVNKGFVWQLFTYMFVHQNYMHLFFNMFALLMFGRLLEYKLGTREFLLFYFVCGFLAGVISYLIYVIQGVPEFFFEGGQIYYYVTQGTPVLIMGASGCVYALMFLSAVIFPNDRLLFFFFISVKIPIAVMIYTAIEIFSQVYGINDGVAHLVHLSGFAIAWLYVVIRFRMNPIRIWKENL